MLRRHLLQTAARIGSLVAADLATFAGLTWALRLVSAQTPTGWLSVLARAAFPAIQGEESHFAVALLLGLAVGGTYGQGDSRRHAGRIASGVALASAMSLWQVGWQVGFGSALLSFTLSLVVFSAAILADRIVVDRLVSVVRPFPETGRRTLFVGDSQNPAHRGIFRHLARMRTSSPGLRWLGGATNGAGAASSSEELLDVGSSDDFWRILQRNDADTVILCGKVPQAVFDGIVEASASAGCRLLAVSEYHGVGKLRPSLVWHHAMPFVELTVPALRAQHLMLKRVTDIVGAALGLTLLSPLFLLVGALIKLDSKGPVFFLQERVGSGGRVFKVVKFRTMRIGADAEKRAVAHLNKSGDPRLFKIVDDPRVTRLGAALRRWSIDELPQLFNVLNGTMSLVGPRPFFEADLASYRDHHFSRLGAKPGITGLWQVSGRSSVVDFEEVVRLDREYIDRWSLWLDLRIMLKTIPAVFRRDGAY